MRAYIGSRTTRERQARGDGITVCRVESDGRLTPVQVLGDLVNPSFLALNRRGDRLYSVQGDGDACSVFAVAPHDGTLTHLQTQGCGARNPVHLVLDAEEARLFVSSHLTGELLALPVQADGTLGAVTQRVAMPGEPGPHRVEQPFAKPHHNPLDPSGRWVVVPDKGLDRLFVFDTRGGALVPAAVPHVDVREGAGPRHVAFHPGGCWLYSVNELDATVTAYGFDTATGALTPLQWRTLMPDTWMRHSRGAEIEVSADGRTLYASHRGADRIEVFAIDADTGRLTHLQSRPSEGRTPRFFALHPDGGFVYALNEDSDTVVTLAVNPADGGLGEAVATLRCGSPVCMVFTRPASPARP
jgi:6-phosphogluconolactonase (cycloisomerase 2 family)